MKKGLFVLSIIMVCYMSACNSGEVNGESELADNDYIIDEVSDKTDSTDNISEDEEEMKMEASNRTIIAEALGVDENNRNIRFILSSLDTICAGKIQSAEATEVDGEKVLNLVAEDGTDYRIFLSGSGSVEAVENLATGEWPIQSNR